MDIPEYKDLQSKFPETNYGIKEPEDFATIERPVTSCVAKIIGIKECILLPWDLLLWSVKWLRYTNAKFDKTLHFEYA